MLKEKLLAIKPLNQTVMQVSQKHWDSIAKPLNSLGLLEKAVVQISGITSNFRYSIDKRAVIVMCADNGVVAEGITQCGSEVTSIVAENLTKNRTSVNQMSIVAHADVFPVDIGINSNLRCDGLLNKKVAYGTKNIALGTAMTMDEAIEAINAGIELVFELKEKGYKIIATGEMGIGNTTTSSAIVSVLLNQPVCNVTGRGAGLSNSALIHKIEVIEKAIAINKSHVDDALDVLAKLGGFDIAGLVGVFLGGGLAGVPIVIDGFISSAAALVAARMCPNCIGYMMASHASNEPAGRMVLDELGLEPIITAKMCLGEGTGAVALLPILDMAYAVYNNSTTFELSDIDQYEHLV